MRLRNPLNEKWHGTLKANLVPGDVISKMSAGVEDERDFVILMDFFCHRWPGRSGNLSGCQIYCHPDNVDALTIFRATGPGGRQSDIESAMRMHRIKDPHDCWKRVMFLTGEFTKYRNAERR